MDMDLLLLLFIFIVFYKTIQKQPLLVNKQAIILNLKFTDGLTAKSGFLLLLYNKKRKNQLKKIFSGIAGENIYSIF